ncbi:hypothetical protein F0562_030974 [Nyssa sinensis]|uniref:Uncharacterized protein n=1 Tax=Nyssa sinensis TaxID=561372 RepID=A0A5J5AV17_9ASTE|nr:hypothetical protein F0562_030974 [Nyssa sinensis]
MIVGLLWIQSDGDQPRHQARIPRPDLRNKIGKEVSPKEARVKYKSNQSLSLESGPMKTWILWWPHHDNDGELKMMFFIALLGLTIFTECSSEIQPQLDPSQVVMVTNHQESSAFA